MTLLLFLLASVAPANDLDALDRAQAKLQTIHAQQARIRAAHRQARRDDAVAAACLESHRREVRSLAWSAQLLAADVRYVGEIGYPAAPGEALVRLTGLVGRVEGHALDAAACLGAERLPEVRGAVVDVEPLPADTEGAEAGMFESWQRPPEVGPFV